MTMLWFNSTGSCHLRDSEFRNPEKLCSWNPKSWALESRIQVPLTKTGIRYSRRKIQNPRLSWIPFHGAKCKRLLAKWKCIIATDDIRGSHGVQPRDRLQYFSSFLFFSFSFFPFFPPLPFFKGKHWGRG